MVTNSRGVTVTQGRLRNTAKARRAQKRQAKNRAKKKLSAELQPPKHFITLAYNPNKYHQRIAISLSVVPEWAWGSASTTMKCCEIIQAEWVAAAEKVSGGRNKAKKEDMEEWVSPSDSVRRRWGYARDTDLNTIRRYELTDTKLALGEIERLGQVDEERAEDAQMTSIVGTPINLPTSYRGNGAVGNEQ
ncbi:MAG: hypothetical protein ASARMPRED_005198 [Alectoria sarmentosa]|nr:MAG: hypothetical protein ASARMPRED_005198 [Alectoria sarmentosa]